ncbi:alpha/beta hydrolase [Baekduia sp.]|jgi:pimeloyl-ACP methyl ester carboxylesterase|uniref:alpha/beta fold hydrolase n=1 Tax=Baekduia sp. TaxID=2600305 RepID=UPI002E01E387|nr:alpha/beta hydrolase [Baekduia sp.]
MTTFALIPGAGSDQWYWSRLVPLLTQRGHEALAPELPVDDPDAGWDAYADAVAAAIGDRTGVVVVAQSMGAFTAPLLCSRVDVARIALLCPMIPAPGDTGNTWWEAAGQAASARAAAEREGRDPDAPFELETTFLHDLSTDVRTALLSRPAPAQEDRLFEERWPLDAWPEVPTTVLAGSRDRLFPLDLVQRLARERLGLDHVETVATGHLAALVAPEAVADWLR